MEYERSAFPPALRDILSQKRKQRIFLYEYFVSLVSAELQHVDKGVFGAHMEVELINDGPVTIVMDSEVLKKKKQ